MKYEYREGFRRIRVELAGDSVSVIEKSPDGSSERHYALKDLSPRVISVTQRDPNIKSAISLLSVAAFVGVIILGMIYFSLGWQLYIFAFSIMIGGIGASYGLTPKREYAVFSLSSGLNAFALKSRHPKEAFTAAVLTLSSKIPSNENHRT